MDSARNIKIYLCKRYTGEKLKGIGVYFWIGESGVSQASRRLKDKFRTDKKLKRKISKSEKNLNLRRIKTCPLCDPYVLHYFGDRRLP